MWPSVPLSALNLLALLREGSPLVFLRFGRGSSSCVIRSSTKLVEWFASFVSVLIGADALLTDRLAEDCRWFREGVFDGRLILAFEALDVLLAECCTLPGVKPNENPKSTLLTLRALHRCQFAFVRLVN